jgi:hypothetical protein
LRKFAGVLTNQPRYRQILGDFALEANPIRIIFGK